MPPEILAAFFWTFAITFVVVNLVAWLTGKRKHPVAWCCIEYFWLSIVLIGLAGMVIQANLDESDYTSSGYDIHKEILLGELNNISLIYSKPPAKWPDEEREHWISVSQWANDIKLKVEENDIEFIKSLDLSAIATDGKELGARRYAIAAIEELIEAHNKFTAANISWVTSRDLNQILFFAPFLIAFALPFRFAKTTAELRDALNAKAINKEMSNADDNPDA